MARLGKIVSLLKIGTATAVDFLQENNQKIEANPNAKLSKEQENLLMSKFATPEILKQIKEKKSGNNQSNATEQKAETEKVSKAEEIKVEIHRPKIVDKVVLDSKGNVVTPRMSEAKPEVISTPVVDTPLVKAPEAKVVEKVEETKPTVVAPTTNVEPIQSQPAAKVEPVVEKQPVATVVDKVPEVEPVATAEKQQETPIENRRTETPKQNSVVEPHQNKTKTSAPSAPKENLANNKAADDKVKEESNQIPVSDNNKPTKAEPEIFSLAKPELKNTINVIGKIDLGAINGNTRPAKKSKEERRKERIAKDRRQQDARKGAAPRGDKNDGDETKRHGNVDDKGGANSGDKKKRKRITGGERVDINKVSQEQGGNRGGDNNNRGDNSKGGNNNRGGKNKNKNTKPVVAQEVSDEDVARQVKETLARLTQGNKGVKKGAQYRKEKREAAAQRIQDELEQEQQESKILKLTEFVTANELSVMMDVTVTEVIQTCLNLGLFVSINQRLDAETINIVADEFGYKTEFVSAEVVSAIQEEEDAEEDLQPRSPIVTVMGHVDHGKTSLLDYIRKTNVIAGEAGGITQHIGAYNVKLDDGRRITFLDTPGHEAFTAMRARGAKVTDIAIIIVAADDDVMPQTVEAINHASAAGVPIVFAINKIDKPAANPDKIKEALSAMNYLVEEWGGKYQSQDISAKKGIGVKELLEKVLLEAELLELKANPDRRASGSIIESSLDKGRGYVSTVLVNNGTLHVGDVMLAGTSYGRVKAMFNERNQRIKQAGPAEPVIVLGLNGAPQAGDNFNVFDQDHEAREIANKREQLAREQGLRTSKHLTLDEIGRRIALGNFQELNLIVKGDVDGSIEALSDSLLKLSTEEMQVNVIHKAVGQISESDVMLATASNAIIVGFQVRPSMDARKLAEREGVDIRLYSIIYTAIEEIKSAMEGMLEPDVKEEITATLEILETFKITKVGTIAGCLVKEGKVKRTNKVRLIRDGIVVYTGELASLKRMKDDVKEVGLGYECGLNIANYNDISVGDIIEAFEEVEVVRTL